MIFTCNYKFDIGKIYLYEEYGKLIRLSFSEIPYKKEETEQKETPVLKLIHQQLVEYFSGQRKIFDIPLNLKGTDFQKKIWNELRKIPYGKTCSYQNIAIKTGNPKASRAIGMANNKNPIAIIIPCHRVLGKNGNLTGYAGGITLKENLLNLEKTFIQQ